MHSHAMPALFVLAAALIACSEPADPLSGRLVDLTHAFDAETIFWPTEEEGFVLEPVFAGHTDGGWWYAANRFRSAEHGGTHLDAPIHFAEGQVGADAVSLARLVAPGRILEATDVGNLAGQAVEAGGIVLIRTGHGRHWGDRARYLGTDRSGPEAVAHLDFPGITPELAVWLVEREVAAVGIDTPSIDPGASQDFQAHRILAEAGVPVFENVAGLDQLPADGFTVLALPMKIRGGSGAPLRIVALIPE
jgi:kynurenine formamidase